MKDVENKGVVEGNSITICPLSTNIRENKALPGIQIEWTLLLIYVSNKHTCNVYPDSGVW